MKYERYIELGGSVSEEDFPIFLVEATTRLDYILSGRFSNWNPEDEITQSRRDILLVKTISLIKESVKNLRDVTSYSNGIESFTYGDTLTEKSVNNKILVLCKEYLYGTDLLYRGV